MPWLASALRFLIIPALLSSLAAANCQCGYVMNDTGEYFTHLIHNNFSGSTTDVGDNFFQNWIIQTWSAGPSTNKKAKLSVTHKEENVGIRDGALILRQKGYSREDRQLGRNVSVAAIASSRTDILHGSFRAEMKVQGAKGGSNDTNEIDIEFLTKEPSSDGSPVIHYTAQPSVDEEDNLIPDATEEVELMSFKNKGPNPFLSHRFDWSSEELRFYQGSSLIHKHSTNIPSVSGSANINIWADGGEWSGTPSTSDVTLSVRSIAIYHNTTASDIGRDSVFNRQCWAAGGLSKKTVCHEHEVESGEMYSPVAAAHPVEPPLYALQPFIGLMFFWVAWVV
ncbi:hypothetical protein FQN54_005499 [Arachnomyces sp. PD_36]|nr:hypothetical protein FQN54_005499 [Arachnomyces sp. PD_36]